MAEAISEEWKRILFENQQIFYEMLGDRDWDSYKKSEIGYLERNIGHAIFGSPQELPDEKENANTGYKVSELEQIRKVIDAIKEHSKYPPDNKEKDIWVSVIFVCLSNENKSIPVPVFRIPHYEVQLFIPHENRFAFSFSKKLGHSKLFKAKLRRETWSVRNVKTGMKLTVKNKLNCWFVDGYCRVYEDWQGYLENNCLPKCTYCYPVDGIYNGDENDNVLVEFGETPACSAGKQIANVFDKASTVITVGGMAMAAAALFTTVAAPLAAATTVCTVVTGAYGVGRSAAALVDRNKHKQSIGIEDAESRSCWLSVAGNSLGMASGHAIRTVTKLTQQGRVINSAGRLLVNALNFSSLAVNGVGLVNNFVLLQEKAKNKELKPLEVFQFASSVLFFTMSAVNMKTANTLIRETQDGFIGDYEANLRSKRHQRQFRRLVRDTKGEEGNSMQANARVIRGINNISNKDDFFAGLVRVRSQFSNKNAKVVLTETGLVEINGELHLHPMKFWEINKLQREFILDATKNLNEGIWTQEHFNKEMQNICQEENLMLNSQENHNAPNMNRSYDRDLDPSSPDVIIKRLSFSKLLLKYTIEHRKEIIIIARNIAEMMECHNTAEIIKIVDFVANYVEEVAGEVEKEIPTRS
ncbi:hypothetical protein L9F63_010966 [Diploptera punctata]|uniref:DUF4781 domain-containing protein n=1 Tax=Diploptera punctata TaxID=6984 RepID=A0AAD8AGI1_DIPPU|nr:hypothetical protein L9F63_010966 [Diploptera punctata]